MATWESKIRDGRTEEEAAEFSRRLRENRFAQRVLTSERDAQNLEHVAMCYRQQGAFDAANRAQENANKIRNHNFYHVFQGLPTTLVILELAGVETE